MQQNKFPFEQILAAVCEHFHVSQADYHAHPRLRANARVRRVALYLAKNLTSASLVEIGDHFGNSDTNVLLAARSIERERRKSSAQ